MVNEEKTGEVDENVNKLKEVSSWMLDTLSTMQSMKDVVDKLDKAMRVLGEEKGK
jgi:hypothetical protein